MLKHTRIFLLLSLLLLLATGAAYLAFPKAEIHLWLNGTHNTFMDYAMRYYTVVGEWIPYLVVAALLFYKAGWATLLLADIALSGGIAQIAKYAADTDRPYRWFAEHYPDINLQFTEGVRLSKYYSFPSGHTTTFFCMFFVLTLVLTAYITSQDKSDNSRQWQISSVNILFFLMALSGAYSRIYLNQHFLEDIAGGVIIGIATTILLLWPAQRLKDTKFWNWNIKNLLTSKPLNL